MAIERHGAVGTIVLAGILDASTSAWVTRALARLEPTRPSRIALDVARLDAIDGSGWLAIRDAVRRCRSRDLPLVMVFGDRLPSRVPDPMEKP